MLMLDDGIHVMVSDVDDHVQLRRLDTGEVVWKSHLDITSICCHDYILYEGDITVIYVYCNVYVYFLVVYILINLTEDFAHLAVQGETDASMISI